METPSWTQLEKTCRAYLERPSERKLLSMNRVLARSGPFTEKVANFFVRNHAGLEACSASFLIREDGDYPEWGCRFDEESRIFQLNLPGVLRFEASCREAVTLMNRPEGRETFSAYRLNAYKAQLTKLPPQMLMFLLLFQEEARVLQVAEDERRRGVSRPETAQTDLDYTNFLWGFRELEKLYLCLKGLELKADVQFVWHEIDWTTGNK